MGARLRVFLRPEEEKRGRKATWEKADIEYIEQNLKQDELAGQMFESEQELACHVIWGLESRGEKSGHEVEFVNLKTS